MNTLYYGDCLTVMQNMKAGSVDLIYLDPPFNSKKNYHSIYKDETGRPLPDQIEAFCDMWTLDDEREREIRNMPVLVRETGIDDSTVEFWKIWMNALRKTNEPLLAYLSYMVLRLAHMRVILKPTGSIYLHCDPTASHYIKIMLDGVFGHRNFRNEIIWCYRGGGRPKADFARKHDVILRYTKTKSYTFNGDDIRIPYTAEGVGRTDDSAWGRHKGTTTIYKPNPGGNVPEDWWDISPINANAPERLGYATQKPLTLINRIIKASTNEGDVVMDPFCGCATTLEAANNLGRRWVGIDIAIHAIKRVARLRLTERCGLVDGTDYEVRGVPRDREGAHDLWVRDKYQFQKWAVEQVEGFVTNRKTADGGIDGRLYFSMPNERDLQSMVIEVKGGVNVGISDVRALGDVVRRDTALTAGLIVMDDLGPVKTRNFKRLMAEAGDLDVFGMKYPRMQMLTVPEILAGERFKTPSPAARHSVKPSLPLE